MIAVTGAAGFLGANLVIALAQAGVRVLAADFDPPQPELIAALGDRGELVSWRTLDVRNPENWADIPASDISAIIHAAAVTTGEADPHPELTKSVNTGGTVNALAWATERGITRFVLVSSSAVYRGVETSEPLHESLSLRPTTVYGQSKLAAETALDLVAPQRGIIPSVARLPSLYGPWERPNTHRRNASPVHGLVAALRRGGSPVRVGGANIGRDWTYVADAAAGLVHLATMPAPPPLVNLSRGEMVTLREMVPILSQLSGIPIEVSAEVSSDDGTLDIVMTPTSGGQPMDVRLLAAAGFCARTTIREGLERYWNWLEARAGSKSPKLPKSPLAS